MKPATVVISDIHNRFEVADAILALHPERPLRVVYLGDYFDDYGDNDAIATITAIWLAHKLDNPQEGLEEIFLLGNHDIPYLYPELHPKALCTGFTQSKFIAIQAVLGAKRYRDKLLLHTWVDSYLLTHAGLTRPFAQRLINVVDNTMEFRVIEAGELTRTTIDYILRSARARMEIGIFPALIAAGAVRGGDQSYGGVTWCDWKEFKSIPGINQIFGHTPDSYVREDYTENSHNLCCDTHSAGYLISTDDGWEYRESP